MEMKITKDDWAMVGFSVVTIIVYLLLKVGGVFE
jgi:hypothetical protein